MIIGIDPGTSESAWVVLQDGIPLYHGKELNAELLNHLRGDRWPREGVLLAVEMIASYGMPVGKEVFDTCLWIGRYCEAWESRGGSVRLVYRREVKQFHCGTVRANDANIRAALLDRYGPGREIAIGTKKAPGPLYTIKGDEWSALAVALTVESSHQHRIVSAPIAAADGLPF
jgi:hypothetical protein